MIGSKKTLPFFILLNILIFSPLGVILRRLKNVDNYILLGLSRKEVKLMNLKEENGIIKVELVSSKSKVRCPTLKMTFLSKK